MENNSFRKLLLISEYTLFIILIIFGLNYLLNLFISLPTPKFISRISGSIDSWIQFNGIILGSIIGGIIGGYIALLISKHQIQSSLVNNQKVQNDKMKYDLLVKISSKIINILSDLNRCILEEQVTKKDLITQINSISNSKEKTNIESINIEEIRDKLEQNLEKFSDSILDLSNSHLSNALILYDYKDGIASVEYNALLHLNSKRDFFYKINALYNKKHKINSTEYEDIIQSSLALTTTASKLHYGLHELMKNLQNILSPIFGNSLEKSEYKNIFEESF